MPNVVFPEPEIPVSHITFAITYPLPIPSFCDHASLLTLCTLRSADAFDTDTNMIEDAQAVNDSNMTESIIFVIPVNDAANNSTSITSAFMFKIFLNNIPRDLNILGLASL